MGQRWMTAGAAMAAAMTASTQAHADDMAVGYTLELASVSSYVWRGDRLSTGAVEPLVQPYGEVRITGVGGGTVTAGLWTSRALTEDEAGQEIDPYLAYVRQVGPLQARASYAVYLLPALDPVDVMHELGLQLDLIGVLPVTPYVGVAIDPIRTDGGYAYGGVTYSVARGPLSLTAKLNVGASDYAANEPSLQDVTVSGTGSWALTEHGVYASATIGDAWSGRADENYPYAGVSVGIAR
jgi:hypothetical protein